MAGMAATTSGPVFADVRVISPVTADADRKAWRATTSVGISAGEPVFAGHYPGFPIFPGMCVVECVHRSALATVPAGAEGLLLSAMESTRFVGSVHPGDELTIALKWSGDGDMWRCAAEARTERGEAARVRLRYRAGADT
ncbi:3-hydroxyacyl-ACP dehydratase FabZ family protein [Streptosporangium sp. NPDC000396]|uniref:3-hydroxyacyl-ACP dehydratase FabZ family protein n=1 Tax=Streptosporangium sp. NPDC000396 TaxID=3366185 RepID=UPI00367B3A48